MRVRWTSEAASDLEEIHDHIAKDRPDSARRIVATLIDGIAALMTFPERGRHGRVEGTRELVFVSLPFVAVYQLQEDDVQVVRILHGAQRWPPA